jgi:heterodisulfide reductase subunit B
MARLKLPQTERSVRLVLTDLGVELKEQPGFTCCPDPVVFRSASRGEWLNLAARNLSLDSGLPLVTLCPGCASSLSEARHLLSEDSQASSAVGSKLKKAGLELGLPEVSHFLRLLSAPEYMEKIGQKVSKKLEGLKVACHYGCHLVRPSSAVGFDDPEKPTSLDNLVALTGAEPVDYVDKYMCCGRPSMDEATSMGIAEHKLQSMKDAGADLLVLACPFCFEQFDLGQVLVERKKNASFGIPVLYASQLLGLAMGRTADEMGLELHRVKVKNLPGC